MPLAFYQSNRHESLAQACQKIGAKESALVSAEQVHADRIAFVTAKHLGQRIPGVDALITNEKNVPLVIRTADCAPVLIHDSKTGILALVHAGRKGTELAITAKTIARIDADPKNLVIKIGPCIGKCCYPMDIRAENLKQLARVGVLSENIEVAPDCTCCNNDTYFSYRGDGPATGRMFLVASLL
ncbi:MAG: polyphenol oxidase family protein [Candidatus Saganbacteria bacterium]|nr:polyphenol oxidase family protein [Candidatus Saganbacteria bacterium]